MIKIFVGVFIGSALTVLIEYGAFAYQVAHTSLFAGVL